jgi:hypothetical protein
MIKKELGGKERGFTFNNYAISVISEKSKGSNSMAFLYAVVYGGMSGYDYAKEIEQDYSFSDVIDWVDTSVNDGETFADVITEMQNSQQFKKLQEKGEKKTDENLPAQS